MSTVRPVPNKFFAKTLVDKSASIFIADGTRNHCTKLLVMDFLDGCISGWIHDLYIDHNAIHSLCETDAPLRYGNPTDSAVIKQYTKKFFEYENITEQGQDLFDAVEFVLQVVTATETQYSLSSSEQRMRENVILVRSRCTQLDRLISRTKNRRDQRYDLYVKNLSIDDSISIKRLTILAAVFLPLSLASSILSMQTRFVQLHSLLYDFLGVFILLASLAFLTYYVLDGFTALSRRDKLWLRREYATWTLRWWSSRANDAHAEIGAKLFLKYSLTVSIWAITIVSFIVGMLLEITLGLKVLGYGVAALFGICLLLFVLAWCNYCYVSS